VLPTDQSLEAGYLHGLELEHRLVIQSKFMVVQCAPELCLLLEARQGIATHLWVEDFVARPAVALGMLQSNVGIAQHVCGGLMVVASQDNTDTGVQKNLPAIHIECILHDFGNPISDFHRLLMGFEIVHQDREFIASQTGDDIARSKTLFQAPGKRL
jgi:hypothetical protein